MLIIEDDPFAAADIGETLKQGGATSFSFADAEQGAIDAARRTRPAVIIADVILMDGTGPGALRRIEAELGHIPVIYVTGTPDQCDDDDADAILEKPFSAPRLLRLFRTIAPR